MDWSHEAIKQTCIQKLLSVHQELVRDRDAGLTKLNNCVESGERLYGSTAPDGREVIRQDLRKLKLGWDSLYDDLSAVQRRLEVSLVQWTSFDESYGQVENWLRDMESQLEGQIPLRSTLEEKKTQQQNYKVDVSSVMLFPSPQPALVPKKKACPALQSKTNQTQNTREQHCTKEKQTTLVFKRPLYTQTADRSDFVGCRSLEELLRSHFKNVKKMCAAVLSNLLVVCILLNTPVCFLVPGEKQL